jgi:hypothetical protein
LSALTYRLVETPLRRPELWRRTGRALVLYPATVALVGLVAVAGTAYSDSLADRGYHAPITLGRQASHLSPDQRATSLVRASVRAAQRDRAIPSTLSPPLEDLNDSIADISDCDYEENVQRLCARGDTNGDKVMVVVGNSHGRHWIPALDAIARHAGYRAYYLVKPQCVGSLVTPDMGETEEPFTDCADFHVWMLQQIEELHPDLVIASTSTTERGVYGSDGGYVEEREDVNALVKDGYLELFGRLDQAADRVVVIRDIPYLQRDPGTCLSTGHADLGDCLMRPVGFRQAGSQDQLEAAQEVGVDSIDPSRWFCWRSLCPSVVGSTIAHRDQGHMTNEYSRQLAEPLGRALGIW